MKQLFLAITLILGLCTWCLPTANAQDRKARITKTQKANKDKKAPKRKGNGLGLLIVRRIIKDHGGTLGFASKEGTGTTVTLTLPRADRVVRLLPA